jgi:hypothetical protein
MMHGENHRRGAAAVSHGRALVSKLAHSATLSPELVRHGGRQGTDRAQRSECLGGKAGVLVDVRRVLRGGFGYR